MSKSEAIKAKLNEVIIVRKKRSNGSVRIQQDFSNCPTMAEQHTAHLTDINYLMQKYKPDELAAYIVARNSGRQEIIGHDFSAEPSLQDARNVVYESKQAFKELPEEVQQSFANHVEFLKFMDSPANVEKLIRLGLIKREDVDRLRAVETPVEPVKTTPTKEKEDSKA